MKKWSIFLWLRSFVTWSWRKLRGARRIEVAGCLNGASFYLNSPDFDDAQYESEEAKAFLKDIRAKFESGELFLPLKTIPDSGGVVIALISEHGRVSQDHILALYPTYMEELKCKKEYP